MSKKHNPLTDTEVAFTAINLFRNKPHGDAPDWHELEAFREHSLSDQRMSEILSHVANDPEQFQLWKDLKEASDWVAVENEVPDTVAARTETAVETAQASSAGIGAWFKGVIDSVVGQPLPALGGAAAAIALAVMVVPNLLQGPDGTLDELLAGNFDAYLNEGVVLPQAVPTTLSTRSTGTLIGKPTAAEADLHHLQLGMQKAFLRISTEPTDIWKQWGEQLPIELLDCAESEDASACTEKAEAHVSLGNWALMSYFACEQGKVGTGGDFWDSQLEIFKGFDELASVNSSAIVNSTFSRSTPPATQEELCSAVNEIVSAGL